MSELLIVNGNTFGTFVLDLLLFFGGNLDFPKIEKLNMVCSNIETCTKM